LVLLRKRGRFGLVFICFLTMVEFVPPWRGKQTWRVWRANQNAAITIAKNGSDVMARQPFASRYFDGTSALNYGVVRKFTYMHVNLESSDVLRLFPQRQTVNCPSATLSAREKTTKAYVS
jgi:hypothetical protein